MPHDVVGRWCFKNLGFSKVFKTLVIHGPHDVVGHWCFKNLGFSKVFQTSVIHRSRDVVSLMSDTSLSFASAMSSAVHRVFLSFHGTLGYSVGENMHTNLRFGSSYWIVIDAANRCVGRPLWRGNLTAMLSKCDERNIIGRYSHFPKLTKISVKHRDRGTPDHGWDNVVKWLHPNTFIRNIQQMPEATSQCNSEIHYRLFVGDIFQR